MGGLGRPFLKGYMTAFLILWFGLLPGAYALGFILQLKGVEDHKIFLMIICTFAFVGIGSLFLI